MSQRSAPEARFHAWLTAQAPPHAPDGLRHRALRAIDEVDQLRPWVARWPILRFSIPAVAAVIALVISIGFVVLAGGLPKSIVPPSATETAHASSTLGATAGPTAEPSTGSPTPVPSLEPVAGLIAGPATCVDETGGFQVSVPAGWYTNEAAGSVTACRYFSPVAFDPTVAQLPTVALMDYVGPVGPSADLIGGPSPSPNGGAIHFVVVERTELTLDGLPTLRVVLEDSQAGIGTLYVVSLDGAPFEPNANGSFFYASTRGGSPGVDRNAAVLDEIMAGFATIGTRPIPTPTPTPATPSVVARIALPHADGQVPLREQVAVTSEAIWTVGSAGTHLAKVDLRANAAVTDVAVDQARIEVDDTGGLWMLAPWGLTPTPATMTLSRIDASTGTVHPFRDVPGALDIAVGQHAVWLLLGNTIRVLDPQTGALLRELPAPAEHYIDLACGGLWTWSPDPAVPGGWYLTTTIDSTGGWTYKLPADTTPRLVDIGDYCWTNFQGDLMGLSLRLSSTYPQDLETTESTPAAPGALQFAGRSAWVVTEGGVAQRIDPSTGARMGSAYQLPVADLHVDANDDPNWRLLSAGGNLWVLNDAELIRYDIPSD